MIKRMFEINKGIANSFNVEVKMNVMDYYKSIINDNDLFESTITNLKEEDYNVIEPMIISQDFSFYTREVPGLFVMLGTKNEKLGFTYPLHHACFNLNEEVLFRGVELYLLQLKIHNCI